MLGSVPARQSEWCLWGAVQLLRVVPTRWALTHLIGYLRSGLDRAQPRLRDVALRALADNQHLLALREVRRYAEDPQVEPKDRHLARRLLDERVAVTLRLVRLEDGSVDVDQRVFGALAALDGWADVLILLRAGHGDPTTRDSIRELSEEDITGPQRAAQLRKLKAAASRS